MARGETLPDRTSGAAVFADISGFTPLTDDLMRSLGRRRGAEEITRVINLVYEALITDVHRYGGSVVGFSGDAIHHLLFRRCSLRGSRKGGGVRPGAPTSRRRSFTVLSVPGSPQYRLPAIDPHEFSNLYLVGDWTKNGLNLGCVESAAMSGLLASNALSGYPEREEIVTLDL